MNRYKVVLESQWKWAWSAILLAGICAFGIPILSVQDAELVPRDASGGYLSLPHHFLQVMERWSAAYTFVAAGLGLSVAMLAWGSDHRGRHVYALTLPIERWRFVLLRYTSGLALLSVPAIALLIGATLAVTNTAIPDGLEPYPLALTLRFSLAAVVSFSLFFAISAGTTRTAAIVLGPIVAIVALDAILAAAGIRAELVDSILHALFNWPGVMEVFTGRWLLVDV